MMFPVRLRSLDSSIVLFAVLLFCAIGGAFSLFYFQTEDNQPLLTLRRRPEDPQLNYPTHSGTDRTTPSMKIPKEQDDPPPADVKNPAAAAPNPHRPQVLRNTDSISSALFAYATIVPGVFSLRTIPYPPIEPVMEVPELSTDAPLFGAASLTLAEAKISSPGWLGARLPQRRIQDRPEMNHPAEEHPPENGGEHEL